MSPLLSLVLAIRQKSSFLLSSSSSSFDFWFPELFLLQTMAISVSLISSFWSWFGLLLSPLPVKPALKAITKLWAQQRMQSALGFLRFRWVHILPLSASP
jgi:hypothetical protein